MQVLVNKELIILKEALKMLTINMNLMNKFEGCKTCKIYLYWFFSYRQSVDLIQVDFENLENYLKDQLYFESSNDAI